MSRTTLLLVPPRGGEGGGAGGGGGRTLGGADGVTIAVAEIRATVCVHQQGVYAEPATIRHRQIAITLLSQIGLADES